MVSQVPRGLQDSLELGNQVYLVFSENQGQRVWLGQRARMAKEGSLD